MYTRRIPFLALMLSLAGAPLLAADPPKYPFAKPPLELLDDLAKADLGKVPTPTDAERKLLTAVWEQKAKRPGDAASVSDDELIDLMLFASGTTDPTDRKAYREKLTDLRAECGKKLDGVKGTAERGEVLLKAIHDRVMKNGYESGQSSLTAVFDTGKQNCVSSSAVVYLVGKSHGFDLRPMSIPGGQFTDGHAFLDLVDGKNRLLLETTSPDGFDSETKLNKPGVVVIGRTTNRKEAREVDGVGVAGMIYANRGTASDKAESPDRPAAAAYALSALALDPLSPTATNNLTAVLANWGPALAKEGKFEDAVRVCEFAVRAAPHSDGVRNNAAHTWGEYVMTTLAAKKDKAAVGLVGRARKLLPDYTRFATATSWFERAGRQEPTWEAGIVVLERGLAVVPEGERKALKEVRSGFYRQWSQGCLDKADYTGSVKALAAGYALDPTDSAIHNGITFHMQEALHALGKKSTADAVEHFTLLVKEFPKVKAVGEAGGAFARRTVHALADAGKYDDATARVEELKALLADEAARTNLSGDVYDVWARKLAAGKEWEKSLDKYAEGLKKYPKHERLANNAIATADDWAHGAMNEKKWDEAIRIYEEGLKRFPDSGHLKHNKDYCQEMRKAGR